jgi:hypothetical protein
MILLMEFYLSIECLVNNNAAYHCRGNKKSTGKLPITHPAWTKLADPNHHNQCQVSKIYNLARAKLEKSVCTMIDAERLKRNLTCTVHKYNKVDFAPFKENGMVSTESSLWLPRYM